MWSSPLFWIVFAIVLFWALGAYNRLMRLRSAAVQAFGSFDAHMVRLVALLGEFGAAQAVQSGGEAGEGAHDLAALQGATAQLSASLAVARARPLQADAVAALVAARDVLQASWQGALRTLPQEGGGTAGERTSAESSAPAALQGQVHGPVRWQVRWDEQALHNGQAATVFNDAVAQYNAAIGQFPASVLAWVFGFQAARGL